MLDYIPSYFGTCEAHRPQVGYAYLEVMRRLARDETKLRDKKNDSNLFFKPKTSLYLIPEMSVETE